MLWWEDSQVRNFALLYIVTAVITNPFYGDPKESPFVRAGTGIHIATVAFIALGIALVVLGTILGVLIFLLFLSTNTSLV